MPRAAIESSTQTPYREPHERESGPWEDHELEQGGHHLERAEQIKANSKFVEAIAKHHEKKASMHRKLAKGMRHHMGRGMISEKAMKHAVERREHK
jgi:hypothetical protein